MKNKFLTAALFATITSLNVQASHSGGDDFKIDTKNSTVEWNAKKVTGEHSGTIAISDGSFEVKKDKVVDGSITINTRSIAVTDMQGEYAKKLEGHLLSEDFFSSEKHPEAKFDITGITPIKESLAGAPNYNIKGNLTIKGITKEIEVPALIEIKDKILVGVATFDVDRTKYDIKYGSASFFEGIGDKAIYDNFTLKMKIIANK